MRMANSYIIKICYCYSWGDDQIETYREIIEFAKLNGKYWSELWHIVCLLLVFKDEKLSLRNSFLLW